MTTSSEVWEIRAALYALLSACLSGEPSAEGLARIRQGLAAIRGALAVWSDPEVAEGLQGLEDALTAVSPEALAVEYAGLFLAGRDGVLGPTESAFREGRLAGEATLAVTEAYARQGFLKQTAFREPEDHVAVECAFLAVIGAQLAQHIKSDWATAVPAVREALAAQQKFLHAHPLAWFPAWASHLERHAELPVYPAVARLALAVLRADERLLAAALA
jgi:TorA maturation chaperone TorD